MIFFQLSAHSGGVVYCSEADSDSCETCGGCSRAPRYNNCSLQVHIPKRVKEWPPFLGSGNYTAASQGVIDALAKTNVSGGIFHELRSFEDTNSAPLPTWLPEPPKYYVWEVTGSIQAKFPLDEGHPCPTCGRFIKKEFGDFKKPLLLIPETWDGSDIVKIKHINSNAICLNRNVIDILRSHGYHRQPWYGRCGRKTEALFFGSRPVPGVSAKNIDSDAWYENTIASLQERFPEEMELLTADDAKTNALSIKRELKPCVIMHAPIPFTFDRENAPTPQTAGGFDFLPDYDRNVFYAGFHYRHRFFGKGDYLIMVAGTTKFTGPHVALVELVLDNFDNILDQMVEPYIAFHPSEKIAKNLFLMPVIAIGNNSGEAFDGTSWNFLVDFDRLFLTHLKFEFVGTRLIRCVATALKPLALK